MEPAQLLTSILGVGGGGAVLLALINGLGKWISGASGREREKNTDLSLQRITAIEERDAANARAEEADKRRRKLAEYASQLRQQLLENGINPDEWPLERTISNIKE
ncbi:hypothetical protein [Glaciihabitans sp. dw_435]|uniref:hypothetical protein n=1 Tax=Glaciihabitans sp. dw_435 TaxID=2720081 RepID=UPI001BD6BE52|nr:hypothetical protein [Glaciihabitans sp. dw_435]